VPYRVYTDPGLYALEQERIFRGGAWNFLGLAAEVANPGDFKATFVGDTPVVVTRDSDGALHAWVNRCAHRGALVCRELRGNGASGTHTCVYHQWAYDAGGNLVGVPFRRGLGGKGGYPADFDLADHGLRRLRVEDYHGLVFGTFDADLPNVEAHIGATAAHYVQRILNRPLRLLGTTRQYMNANWKVYAENLRDPYHASLLHLFHCTFGLYRSTQEGGIELDPTLRHSVLTSKNKAPEAGRDGYVDDKLRTYDETYALADPTLLAGRPEFADGKSAVIQTIFPNLVIQQIANTLAVRQVLPKGVRNFELVWTHFGYADDDAELTAIRLKQFNLIGPAGLISMEDGEATELVQRAAEAAEAGATEVIEMEGRGVERTGSLLSEGNIRAFWQVYRDTLGL
jgi:anthranilate 1,2-dioxygenase large subunit